LANLNPYNQIFEIFRKPIDIYFIAHQFHLILVSEIELMYSNIKLRFLEYSDTTENSLGICFEIFC